MTGVRYQVRSFDSPLTPEEYARLPKQPVTVVLDNLRSAFNVGSIFRTADAARIERVVTCGYTAHPPHLKLEKTSLGTEKFVATRHCPSALQAVNDLKALGIPVVALETAENVPCYSDFAFPRPVALLVGNEALGITREALESADHVVRIPLFGFKNSLNVASAFAVVLFEALRQWGFNFGQGPGNPGARA